jgi:NCAIR mutase (PurE)-related protein
MKKIFLITITFLSSLYSFGQSLAEKANVSLSFAQKATTVLARTYNLSAEQAKEVKKIQDSKYDALAKLESIKAQDLKKYIAKRLSTFATADNDLMVLLDAQQLAIFKLEQIEKVNKYDTIVGGMKKQGISVAEIDKKLAETEF